jgi:hypothetical protein
MWLAERGLATNPAGLGSLHHHAAWQPEAEDHEQRLAMNKCRLQRVHGQLPSF